MCSCRQASSLESRSTLHRSPTPRLKPLHMATLPCRHAEEASVGCLKPVWRSLGSNALNGPISPCRPYFYTVRIGFSPRPGPNGLVVRFSLRANPSVQQINWERPRVRIAVGAFVLSASRVRDMSFFCISRTYKSTAESPQVFWGSYDEVRRRAMCTGSKRDSECDPLATSCEALNSK